MAAAFAVSVILQTVFHLDSDNPVEFAYLILITVAITTVVWLAVTFLTAPETDATLRRVLSARAAIGPGMEAGSRDSRPKCRSRAISAGICSTGSAVAP